MNVIQPLIELQDVDDMIRELEMEEKDIPCRKAQETARLAGVNASLEIAKNQLAAMQKRIADERAEAAELREKAQQLRLRVGELVHGVGDLLPLALGVDGDAARGADGQVEAAAQGLPHGKGDDNTALAVHTSSARIPMRRSGTRRHGRSGTGR